MSDAPITKVITVFCAENWAQTLNVRKKYSPGNSIYKSFRNPVLGTRGKIYIYIYIFLYFTATLRDSHIARSLCFWPVTIKDLSLSLHLQG